MDRSLPLLTFTNVVQQYDSQKIIDIPFLELPHGLLLVQGANGVGKSTLFRTIAHMEPYRGKIVLNGNVDSKKESMRYRQQVRLAEAEPVFPSFLTPSDVITFVGNAQQASNQQIHQLVETLGITGYLQQPFGACSSGMLKKVSLLLAFLGDPQLIILDEPLTTIDVDAQTLLADLIRSYQKRGVSFLLSSHHLLEESDFKVDYTYQLVDKTLKQL